jgi:hypothetical protein
MLKVIFAFSLLLICSCPKGKVKKQTNVKVIKSDDITKLKSELQKWDIDFEDEFYQQFPIVGDNEFIIDSYKEYNRLIPNNDNWTFPFVYMEGPVSGILEAISIQHDYNYFIIGYQCGLDYLFKNYLFTYSKEGKIIDLVCLPDFSYGKGAASLIVNSNFVKDFNNAGFSEIKISKNEIQCNSSNLKLYNNGTEEITRLTAKYKITDDGKINLINSDSSLYYYYRNGVLDHSHDFEIRQFDK